MLADKEALKLPLKGTFLREYVQYCYTCTDAPVVFHLFAGMSLLSAMSGQELTFRWAGLPRKTNIYTMLIGRSGQARKTTAVELPESFLKGIYAEVIGIAPASDEGLITALAERDDQILFYTEFGHFLTKSSAKSYMNGLRSCFVELFDGGKVGRVRASRKNTVICENPRLNILAGTTLDWIEKHTDATDWSGGLMSRWCIVVANRERDLEVPMPSDDDKKQIAAQLQLYRTKDRQPQPFGKFSEAALKKFKSFTDTLKKYSNSETQNVVARVLTDRIPLHVMKLSVLATHDLGVTRQKSYEVPEAAMSFAVRLGEIMFETALELEKTIAEDDDRRKRRLVMNATSSDEKITVGELIRRTHIQLNKLEPVVRSLVAEGYLETVALPGTGTQLYWGVGRENQVTLQ